MTPAKPAPAAKGASSARSSARHSRWRPGGGLLGGRGGGLLGRLKDPKLHRGDPLGPWRLGRPKSGDALGLCVWGGGGGVGGTKGPLRFRQERKRAMGRSIPTTGWRLAPSVVGCSFWKTAQEASIVESPAFWLPSACPKKQGPSHAPTRRWFVVQAKYGAVFQRGPGESVSRTSSLDQDAGEKEEIQSCSHWPQVTDCATWQKRVLNKRGSSPNGQTPLLHFHG